MTSNTNQPEPSFEKQLDDLLVKTLVRLFIKDQGRVWADGEADQKIDEVKAAILTAHNQAIAPAVQTAEAAAAVQLRKDNDFIRMVKREAVREFAERVKTEYEIIPNDVPFDMDKFVDYVVRASQLGEHKE